jgi:hypothetical protein
MAGVEYLMKIWLADTSIRQYRRKDKRVALRLRSYLMIEGGGFRLGAYMRAFSGYVEREDGDVVELHEISFTDGYLRQHNIAVHDFWAFGIAEWKSIHEGVARVHFDYHLSFTGHPCEEPDVLEFKAPLLRPSGQI